MNAPLARRLPVGRLRVWHLAAIVAAAAVAGAFVRESRLFHSGLIALAVTGFFAWCLIAAIGFARLGAAYRRFDQIPAQVRRRGLKALATALYILAGASLFFAGIAVFLAIQLVAFPTTL